MKTKLTQEIEKALRVYYPTELGGLAINKFRDQFTAFEIPVDHGTTNSGIIDCVRISEYFGNISLTHRCSAFQWKKEGALPGAGKQLFLNKCRRALADPPRFCEETSCKLNCIGKEGTPAILISCFEIKVTKADFKSKNGHNFVGNLNYYVVPNELVSEILPLVPQEIGIIAYLHTDKMTGLRKKRNAAFRDMSDQDQKWMILSVMSRVRNDLHEQLSKKERIEYDGFFE